jgi:glycosyltransferase involved in cell wall biosynthesis
LVVARCWHPLLAEALVCRHHEINVLTDRRPQTLPPFELRNGVIIHRLKFRNALAGNTALIADIRKYILQLKHDHRPDVSLIFSSRYGDYFHYITHGPSSPLILSLHDCFPAAMYHQDTILGRHLRTANQVAACSRAVLATVCAHVPNLQARAAVIRNALPMPASAIAVSKNPAQPKLVYLGRLIFQKGVDVLIAAIAILIADYPWLRLEIAGTGDELPALKQQTAALNIVQAIEFKGALNRTEARAFLADADLVVMPSRSEPFGLVALEAAQLSRPVIASAVGGLPEIVIHGQTGLLVPPEDSQALADAIENLLKIPQCRVQLGRNARIHASQKFRWGDYVGSYESLLEAACR